MIIKIDRITGNENIRNNNGGEKLDKFFFSMDSSFPDPRSNSSHDAEFYRLVFPRGAALRERKNILAEDGGGKKEKNSNNRTRKGGEE